MVGNLTDSFSLQAGQKQIPSGMQKRPRK